MKSGILCLLGGTLALAGCSSQAGSHPTPTTKPAPAATARPIPPTAIALRATAPPAGLAAGNSFDRGKAYLRERNYQAAVVAFRAAIAQNEHLAESYAGLGTSALGLGNFPTAYQAYRSAATLAPRNAGVLYYTAYAALHAQDFHAALSYATRYIDMRPSDANGYHLRLLAYGHLYKQKAQVKDARVIVRLQPHNAAAYDDLGIALANDSEFGKSIAAFTEAIKLQPANASFYTNRAIAENLDHHQTAALQDLYAARARTKDSATLKRLGLAINNLKKHLPH